MIKNAIDNEYLAEFLDSTTYQINKPLHEVMTTLYEIYGQVRRSDTKIVEREVENMSYDLSQPPSIIWKAIDDLQKLAKAAKIGYSDEQLTEMGITIIQNTHDFEKGLDDWIDKVEADKTYANLKKHFNDAYKKLQKIRGDDMLQSAQHHANAMRMDIAAANTHLQEEMMANVSTLKEDILAAITEDKENTPPISHSMNAATSIDAITQLTNTIAQLNQRVQQMEQSVLQAQPTTINTDKNDPNYNIPFWLRANNRFTYCWSCGSNASHTGAECKRKKEGHIDNATYTNRQGGSVNRIPKEISGQVKVWGR